MSRSSSCGAGSDSGDDACERELLQPVALGEVAEGGVRRDELPSLAVGQTAAEIRVELVQVEEALPGRGAEPDRAGDRGDDPRESHGVEPDMWIALLAR